MNAKSTLTLWLFVSFTMANTLSLTRLLCHVCVCAREKLQTLAYVRELDVRDRANEQALMYIDSDADANAIAFVITAAMLLLLMLLLVALSFLLLM